MMHTELPLRFLGRRILQLFYQPAMVFEWIASEGGGLWKFPLMLLTTLTLLRILIGGWFQAHKMLQGEIQLPPDWMYYTPEMQAQYMQAAEATKSPVFVYVIPVLIGLAMIWLGWIIISSLLHLAFTVVGGRGTNSSALNLVAWAALPFSLRELIRIIYILFARHPITSAGLSGFVSVSDGGGLLFVSALLALIDIFLFWHIALLVIGATKTETITNTKSLAVVLTIIALSLVVQAGTSYLGSQMGGMMVTRPFYF
jgi:hypothetical protein